jgi:hypothetical protein
VYCETAVAPEARPGAQATCIVAVVACSSSAPANSCYDFSSDTGCQNWWVRFSPILGVANVDDLPQSLGPFAEFSMLDSLSLAQNHVLKFTTWCTKLAVTHAFRVDADEHGGGILKLTARDETGGRANLLLHDEWARQCVPIRKDDTLIVSGATLEELKADPSSLHPKHISFDLVLHRSRAPESRLVVIPPMGAVTSSPSIVLTANTFDRPDIWPVQGQDMISAVAPSSAPPSASSSASSGRTVLRAAVAEPRAVNDRRVKKAKRSQVYVYTELASLHCSSASKQVRERAHTPLTSVPALLDQSAGICGDFVCLCWDA